MLVADQCVSVCVCVCVCVVTQRESTASLDVMTGRDVTDNRDDVADDVPGGGARMSTGPDAPRVDDYDGIESDPRRGSRQRPSPDDDGGAEQAEEMDSLDVDGGRGTVSAVDHGADAARSGYRTSFIDGDVSTLY